MSGAASNQTTDHEEIRNWVEEHGGRPARVESTGDDGGGLLRIDFDEGDDDLEPISWDEFFEEFEGSDLALVYDDETEEGEDVRFTKLVSREA